MDNLKHTFAKKLLFLRTQAGMTQSELGDKLSYSDKTVSKWERGEAIPDATVLKKISRIFSVSVDSLLEEPSEGAVVEKKPQKYSLSIYPAIARTVLMAIWTAALMVFVLLWLLADLVYWMVFVYTVPLTAVAMLVFNSTWHKGQGNFWIVSALVLSVIAVVYLSVLPVKNAWQLFLLVLPAEALVYLSFRIVRKREDDELSKS